MPDFTVNRYGTDTSGRTIWMTTYMHDWWERVVARLGFTPTIVQGAFMVRDGGGAAASAGYHDAAGCIDVRIWNLTTSQQRKLVRTCREMGAAAWRRGPKQGMDPHCHITLGTDRPLSAGARASWESYLSGHNGLANNGPDYEWRPSPLVTEPPSPEEDDVQLSDKINKDTTVLEVFRQMSNFVKRSDARHKKMLDLLKSLQDRSDVPADVKAAVLAALEEDALDVNINVHGKATS